MNLPHLTGYGVKIKVNNLKTRSELIVTDGREHARALCLSKRKGVHFYVSIVPPVDAGFANELQWLLGDDCQRVDFNRARIESGLNEWNKLFELPGRRLRTIYRGRML